jgi:uncharacterized membrane protein (DUF4010 family)
MNHFDIISRIILATVFGLILGLETETREIHEKGINKAKTDERKRIGGIRTYTVISLIGAIAGLLFLENEKELVYMIFASLIFLVISAYILNIQWRHFFGMTTEIAILITFLLGFLVTSQILSISIILSILVILTFFLSQKRGVGKFVSKIDHQEIIDLTKFGLIGLVILPVLPDKSYSLGEILNYFNVNINNLNIEFQNLEIINPFNIWLVVVLMSGFNLIGYILSKFVGTKGSLFAEGLFGGLISSTSTISALAQQSKKQKAYEISIINSGSALIANSVSFIQILIIIYVSNMQLFKQIFPAFVLMGIIGFSIGTTLIIFTKTKTKQKLEINSEPFSLLPALKFVSLTVIIKLIIQISQLSIFKNFFLAIVMPISGLVGMDAPSFAIAELNATYSISTNLAIILLLTSNALNFAAKIFYAHLFGTKNFRNTLSIGLLLTLVGSLIMLF